MQHPGHMPAETIERMMTLLLESIQSPGPKKGLWKFQNPDSVIKAAWVYGQSAHAHQELPVDVGEIPDSRWYPCLVAYNNEDPGYQNVLCKPLLENGCKRPFRTHESRIIYINVDAPPPQPQHFEHSTVIIEEIFEPQPEHFERSTVQEDDDAPPPQPQHFEHSTVTIEEIIEPQPEHFERSTVQEVIEPRLDTVDDAWRNYRWGWWQTCPEWARFVEESELQASN